MFETEDATEFGRKHSFGVVLPRRIKNHSEIELNLMRLSLLNAIIAANVHLSRIEKELKQRGIAPFRLQPPLTESRLHDILDIYHDGEHIMHSTTVEGEVQT